LGAQGDDPCSQIRKTLAVQKIGYRSVDEFEVEQPELDLNLMAVQAWIKYHI
jgi:hypothetical protein